jgi:hypothetical protein
MNEELKDRIEARRHELLSKYNDLKADTRHGAGSARDAMKEKLDELEDYLKDGWDRVSDATRNKLNKWLDK